jgi:hypothetical protein
MSHDRNSVIVYSNITTTNELLSSRSSCIEVSKNKRKVKSKTKKTKFISISSEKVLVQGDNVSKASRSDVFGNPIVKGNKNYKVTFRDKTSIVPLTDEIGIKSYKKYYNDTENDQAEQKVKTACCGCGCVIM